MGKQLQSEDCRKLTWLAHSVRRSAYLSAPLTHDHTCWNILVNPRETTYDILGYIRDNPAKWELDLYHLK